MSTLTPQSPSPDPATATRATTPATPSQSAAPSTGGGLYVIAKELEFAAAHQVRGYKGGCENLHGHNWRVRLTVAATTLNHLSMVIDFRELKRVMRDVIAPFDHRHMNEVAPFDDINPTSENVARYVFEQAAARLDDGRVRVVRVDIWENDTSKATFVREPAFAV